MHREAVAEGSCSVTPSCSLVLRNWVMLGKSWLQAPPSAVSQLASVWVGFAHAIGSVDPKPRCLSSLQPSEGRLVKAL